MVVRLHSVALKIQFWMVHRCRISLTQGWIFFFVVTVPLFATIGA